MDNELIITVKVSVPKDEWDDASMSAKAGLLTRSINLGEFGIDFVEEW